MANKYIHKKTGKPYSIVSNNFMMKKDGKWIKDLILYKAEYNNPDGEYFARTKEDFYTNFTEVKPDSFTLCKWTFSQPIHPIIAPNGRFAPSPIQVNISDTGEFIGTIEDYAGKLKDLFTKLTGKTESQIQEFLDNQLEPCLSILQIKVKLMLKVVKHSARLKYWHYICNVINERTV